MKRTLFLIVGLTIVSTFCLAQNLPADNKSTVKLFRFGSRGDEKPGVLTVDGKKLDVSAFGEDYNETFLQPMGSPVCKNG